MLIHHSKNAMPKIGRFPGLVHCQTNMKNTSENSVQTQSQSPIAEFTRLFCHSCYKSSSGTPATLHPWRCPAINLLFFGHHTSISERYGSMCCSCILLTPPAKGQGCEPPNQTGKPQNKNYTTKLLRHTKTTPKSKHINAKRLVI